MIDAKTLCKRAVKSAKPEKNMNTQYTCHTTDSMDLTVENSTIYSRGGHSVESPRQQVLHLLYPLHVGEK